MTAIKRIIAFLLILVICFGLCACGGQAQGGYNTVSTLGTREFRIAFREADHARDYVLAALRVLQADGTIHSLAAKWFYDDNTAFVEDGTALDSFTSIPQRTLIVGICDGSLPMSGTDAYGNYTGFDVELATAVCEKLGWSVKFHPIDPDDYYVELASGNVDCVWGGMSFPDESGISLSETYLTASYVIASPSGEKIRSARKLSGKVLAATGDSQFSELLNSDTDLVQSLAEVRICDDPAACFEAVRSGECDALLTDSVMLAYYAR